MRHPFLSIRRVLIGFGIFGIVIAAALAGLGMIGMRLQAMAVKQVLMLEEAVQNHITADAFMDDMRTDVLRALQTSSGANEEGERAVRDDLTRHAQSVWTSVSVNLQLRLAPDLHDEYVSTFNSLIGFSDATFRAVELAFSDPAAGAQNYEEFRRDFASFETSMDDLRADLDARLATAKADGTRTAKLIQEIIVGAMLAGLLVLAATTAGAVRAAGRITSALARSRAKEQHLSLHDGLTGLPNRTRLLELAADALSSAGRHGQSVGMLSLNLDRFKQVNETLGHEMGDALLRCVADRLRTNVREGDTVARLGGDEFAVVQSPVADAAEAGGLARRLAEIVSAPYQLSGREVVVSASIGIALAPGDAADVAGLLKKADIAMDRAKFEGKGSCRFFESDMDARLQARHMLEAGLRNAIATNELELHYQPLVALASCVTVGFEALVRWRHPQRGMVSPGEFIPLAEETGLIVPIGEWVLHRACADAMRWPDHVSVAVNVSAVQFERPGLVAAVARALTTSGLGPERLELEITETALMMDVEATLATLRHLRELGVRIAMDDFGTGYSSLSYLRRFPFDKIKIDQCFVRDIETSGDCKAIIRAVAGLGMNLGIATTAEGVETFAQFEQVRAEGCNLIQGYYFSRPMPIAEVHRLIATDWAGQVRGDAEDKPCSPVPTALLAPVPA